MQTPTLLLPSSLLAFLLSTALAALSGCGGSSDDESIGGEPEPQRGGLIDDPPTQAQSYSASDLSGVLGGIDVVSTLLGLDIEPRCSIELHRLAYRTADPQGELAEASGALMIPNGPDEQCQGQRPIVLYAHGTTTDANFNLANFDNADEVAEGPLIAAAFASQGYIVVAPNYLGYDTSTLDYHPFLNADQQSKDMIDALTAARSALALSSAPDTTDSGELFITGYSEGGYVAMATHRAMEDAGMTVTASAPMSGPYALSAFGDAIFQGRVSGGAPIYLTLLLMSYQRAYGNIYTSPEEVFEAQYAGTIVTLLPSTLTRSELRDQGLLPQSAIFSSIPPDPAYASITPATEPAEPAALFALGFGSDNLLTNEFRLAYLQDAEANPDRGFPTFIDGSPPEDPDHPLRVALKTNDLRNWTPESPVLMCGGNLDPVVFYLNTQLMQAYWEANAPDAQVTVLDVDAPVESDDPFEELKQRFDLAADLIRTEAVLGGADDGGQAALLEVYHTALVAPFCLSAAKSFFDAQRE